ncbi:hypothetical protein C0992_006351 [Termitomyces sp. T32_za158]|nr:hypothetical protein C0992_006351 [Termitomyces sp. T32_za158]
MAFKTDLKLAISKTRQPPPAEPRASILPITSAFVPTSQKAEKQTTGPRKVESTEVPWKEEDLDSSSDADELSNCENDVMEERIELQELIDVPKKKGNSLTQKGGRPRVALLDELLQECYRKGLPEKHLYRCAAQRCGTTWTNRNTARILRHSQNCYYLPLELRNKVTKAAASKAPSNLVKAPSNLVNVPTQPDDTLTVKVEKEKVTTKLVLERARAGGRKERHRQLDLAIVKLVCAAGLSTSIVERPEWLEVLRLADPMYTPASRGKIEDEQIFSEVAAVRIKQIETLKKEMNLTISYNGGTARGRDAFWTVHISTEDRRVFFMQGRNATLIQLRILFGLLILNRWISTSKSLLTSTDFASHLGKAEFDSVRMLMGGGRGLETVGKTRFGTIIHSAKSVQRNIPIISQVVERGEFDLGDLSEYFKDSLSGGRRTKAASSFVTILGQLVDIGSPATTVLAHLESNEASPADVFVYWHAFLQATSEVLHDEAQEIPNHVRSEILGILNYRDRQVFVDGNLSDGADVYLAGAYLHPVSQKEIFHGNKPALTRWKGHAKAFKTQFLEEMKKYGRRQPPYNQAFTEQQGIMLWWRSLEDQEFGQILPVLALKIHAVRANSMAEERTVSNFTWITPALRNRLSIESMVAITQIRQFYSAKKQIQKGTNPRPSARFLQVKHQETPVDGMDADDEQCDAWLDTQPDVSENADQLEVLERGIVNMSSASLKSILQGGTKQVLKKAMQNEKGLDLGTEDDNDNDFTMSL